MNNIAPLIVTCAKRSVGLADLLLKDVPADRFARLPIGPAGPVQTNHPAFVYGHLASYPPKALAMLGHTDIAGFETPDDQNEKLKAGAQCLDDPDGSIYPDMDTLVARFRVGHAKILEVLEQTSDEVLLRETPDERYRERFPTVGIVVNFLFNDHIMFHIGQASAWRRMEGLGSAM